MRAGTYVSWRHRRAETLANFTRRRRTRLCDERNGFFFRCAILRHAPGKCTKKWRRRQDTASGLLHSQVVRVYRLNCLQHSVNFPKGLNEREIHANFSGREKRWTASSEADDSCQGAAAECRTARKRARQVRTMRTQRHAGPARAQSTRPWPRVREQSTCRRAWSTRVRAWSPRRQCAGVR